MPVVSSSFLLTALFAAFSSAELREEAGSTPALTLCTIFEGQSSRIWTEALREELASITRPTGLRVRWRTVSACREGWVKELVLVRFTGTCNVPLAPQAVQEPTGRRGPLGLTHIIDGEILTFIDVDCDAVRKFLGRSLTTKSAGEGNGILGRAVARVLAHELYHILAETTLHADSSVRSSRLTPGDLLNGSIRFTGAEVRAIREGRLRSLFQAGR